MVMAMIEWLAVFICMVLSEIFIQWVEFKQQEQLEKLEQQPVERDRS